MGSRSIRFAAMSALLAVCVVEPALAQQDDTPASVAHPANRPSRIRRHSHKVTPAKAAAAPAPAAPMQPWAAVDPGRAGAVATGANDGTVPMPGQPHVVRPDEDRLSYGMKWNSSNAPNTGPYSQQGVIDEVNHDLGAPSDVGTAAEGGVRLKF